MFDEQQYFDAPFPPFEPIQEQVIEEPKQMQQLEDREGVFEQVEGQVFGFLRLLEYNFQASDDDVYVPMMDVKRYKLRNGDYVKCQVDINTKGKYVGCVKVYSVNYKEPVLARNRVPFERLIPVFPTDKFTLVDDDNPKESVSARMIDLFTPIGKGQRGMIVAQPKTGKTTLLKTIANAITKHHPEVYMIVLLIDERPEEVTDMKRSVENAMVISSTFDESADHHIKVAKMVYEHARRMVESGHDVVILMDSITRLARAYNTEEPSSGKVLSGGVDPKALHKPKQFFGAARNIEDGGSLTILATALIETGSKMDDFIFEEFKGTGNMELQLSRAVANRRMFPAMDIVASSTRRDDLLQEQFVCNRLWGLRRMLSSMPIPDATELIINNMDAYKTNQEFLDNMNKNGFSK